MVHANFDRAQAAWDGLAKGDPTIAWDALAPEIRVENGPGAGPWRIANSRDELFGLLIKFAGVFGDTFHQEGRCVYADDEVSVVLVHETGVHATSGDTFDNRAVYVSRLDADGIADRLWTVDLDADDMNAFWSRNPVAEP
jgi:hypothetical protein